MKAVDLIPSSPIRALGMPIVILALFALFALLQPAMASFANLENLLKQTSLLFMLAAAQLLVLICRGFDLSVGANVSLVSVVSCMVMVAMPEHAQVSIATAVLVALAIGCAIGAVNGLLIAYLEINPFVVTLGTMSILTGLATTISNGFPVFGVPEAFTYVFNQSRPLGLPAPLVAAIALAALLHLLLTRTTFGRILYLIGDNARAAMVAGRNVKLHLFLAYSGCGAIAALAGLMMTAGTGSGEPNLGTSLVLNSIAAAVVGGASLRGGVGSVQAPILGALLVTIVSVGMNLAQIDGSLQSVIIGFIVIVAAFAGTIGEKLRR
ncbi:ABC transporter permease [Rhizobium binxianense]|uniref:ABC transporter permease n=1 Tax=Rhizobium binxianense TaxID=3024242 RepID=UPI00234E4A43|nr:ABC transporter permease [Rhizobium sp. BC56]MDC7744393.1 ABC transporter permease [Rhizobium sp. BC56]